MNKILCILIIIILLFLCCILLFKLFKKTNGLFHGGNLIPLQTVVSPELMIHYVSPCNYKLFTFDLHKLFLNIPICVDGPLEEIFMENVTTTINNYIDKENKQIKQYKKYIDKYIDNFIKSVGRHYDG